MCWGWFVLRWNRMCTGCRAWKGKYPTRGVCPRCQYEAHLNTDGLCKPCLQAIRAEDDAEWALALDTARPRHLQLLLGTGRDNANQARPLSRGSGHGPRVGEEWRLKLKQQRETPGKPSAVLQPQTWGQIPLFTLPRTLTDATARAISGRPVPGWEQTRTALSEMASEHGLTTAWQFKVGEMVRLALAIREAEGTQLLPEAMLRDLPSNGDAVRLILLRTGLLEAAPQPIRFSRTDQPSTRYITVPAPPHGRLPRSCRDCDAWMPSDHRALRCHPCRHWRERYERGQCSRCRRGERPLRDGRCRTCHPYRLLDEAQPSTAAFTQLLFDLPAGIGGPVPPFPVEKPPRDADEQAPAWQTCHGQQALFTIRREWTPVLTRLRGKPRAELSLTRAAQRLVDEFAQLRKEQRSPDYDKNIHTLTILVYWLGAATAIYERDVHDLARLDPNLAAKPVCQFLRARGLLLDDPALHQDVDRLWIESALSALPEQVAGEVRTWVTVQRGLGRRDGGARGYDGIRRYLVVLQPILTVWTRAGVTTLRQITRDHVGDAVDALSGHARRYLAICLRSLFKTLKRQRVIFRDPTRQLPVGDLNGVPRSVPSDVLAGLLDQVTIPLGRLVIALAAVHAMTGNDIRMIMTTDLNLARGTLEIRNGLLRHIVYIEEFTHRLATEWLAYRHQRWPASTNPHLLVSQKTALDPDHPAVSMGMLHGILPKGLTLDALRQDRILHEAFETADPLRLMRLFGITERTAMRYVTASHPHRTAKLPR